MTAEKSQAPFTPDPLLGSLLGLCPVIFVTSNFGVGVIVAVGFLFCVSGMRLLLPALRSLFPPRLRAPLAFGLAASLAALFSVAAEAYSPALASLSGIFIPLTLVNCLLLIVLRQGIQAESGPNLPVAVTSLRYFGVIVSLGAIRELLGRGSLTLPVPGMPAQSITLFEAPPLAFIATSAGGFILLGCLAAAYRFLERRFFLRRIP